MEWGSMDFSTARMKTPTGWIVKVTNKFPLLNPTTLEVYEHYGFVTESITFVPDPNHEWII